MEHKQGPPRLAELLLLSLLREDQQASILGDLEQMFREEAHQSGLARARLSYWREALSAAPLFFAERINQFLSWRYLVSENGLVRAGWGSAALGALLLLPALLLVIPGLLFSLFGIDGLYDQIRAVAGMWIDNPWTVLGGMAIALVINTLAVIRVKFENTASSLRSDIELKKNWWNLSLLVLAGLLASAIFAYLVVENLGPLF